MSDDRPDLDCPHCEATESVEWYFNQYGRPISDASYKRGSWTSGCKKCGRPVKVRQHSFYKFTTDKR